MTTLLDWLLVRYPAAKRQTLKRMAEEGRVTVNGRPARRLKDELPDGAEVRVDERPAKASPAAKTAPAALPFDVVHEDADVLVVNKPAGLLTSTVPREPRPTLLAAVRAYVAATDPAARLGLVHRLDRDASGLLVFSKSDLAYKSLKTQFFVHSVTRVYTAVVRGVPTPREGTVDTRLVERGDGTVYSTTVPGKGQRAVTEYKTVAEETSRRAAGEPRRCLVTVKLRTGRKHQIRVHLSERGTPIVGDEVYGRPDPLGLRLAATTLAFDHPRTGERVTFQVAPPPSFTLDADVPARPAAPTQGKMQ